MTKKDIKPYVYFAHLLLVFEITPIPLSVISNILGGWCYVILSEINNIEFILIIVLWSILVLLYKFSGLISA